MGNRGNWTLIGLLVTAAIVAVAAVYLVGSGSLMSVKSDNKLLDKSSTKKTVVGRSIDTAKAEVCRQQLDQIRTGIVNYKAVNGSEQNPATFKDIGLGVSNTFYQCPVSMQSYVYDPAIGKVTCPTHPHL